MQAKSLSWKRGLTHLFLGSIVVVLLELTARVFPGKQRELQLLVLGYLSLLLICLTLLIGPLYLLRQRRNPVNIDLRRDMGIWAGITGCLHVWLAIEGRLQYNQLLLYFLRQTCCGYTPLLTVMV